MRSKEYLSPHCSDDNGEVINVGTMKGCEDTLRKMKSTLDEKT